MYQWNIFWIGIINHSGGVDIAIVYMIGIIMITMIISSVIISMIIIVIKINSRDG